MCFGGSPDPVAVPAPTPPIDREAEAAQKAYGRSRARQANAFNEEDTDIVGSLFNKKPKVNTQSRTLMGAPFKELLGGQS